MTESKKTATIYDIAKATNFSAATVSRVLNGKSMIKPETRELIMEAAEKLNYRPNIMARSLKTNNSKQIMLSIPHLNSAFYFDLIEAVQQKVSDNGYSLLLQHTHANEREELELLRNIRENNIDGLILISINVTEKHFEELSKINCPKVISGIGTNRLGNPHNLQFDYVGIDTEEGLFLATEHLIKQGHTHIGYVGLPQNTQTGAERFSGYASAMQKWGLEINDKYLFFGGYSLNFGYEAGKALCRQGNLPTAIATTCDHICLGLYKAFEEEKVRIPDDVAVIGMDNIDVSVIVKPKLSTVSIASAEIGRMAGDIMIKRLGGWDVENQNIIFRPRLIIRESSISIAHH